MIAIQPPSKGVELDWTFGVRSDDGPARAVQLRGIHDAVALALTGRPTDGTNLAHADCRDTPHRSPHDFHLCARTWHHGASRMLCIRHRYSRGFPHGTQPTIAAIYGEFRAIARPELDHKSCRPRVPELSACRSAAGGREVLVVGVRPAPAPRPSDRGERRHEHAARIRHARPVVANGRGTPSPRAAARRRPRTYGFSTVFTSIASPYACTDQRGGPGATASRQLNAEVLSAAIDAGSLPPNAATGSMRRIGNSPDVQACANTLRAPESTTAAFTIIAPV